jgi:hypothetical protein
MIYKTLMAYTTTGFNIRYRITFPYLHWWWFVPFQTWTSCIQRGHNSLHLYNKSKNNYRSRWCIHANCRSVCYRQLNISTDFPWLEANYKHEGYYFVRCFYMTVTVRSTTIITDYVGMLGVLSLRLSLILSYI